MPVVFHWRLLVPVQPYRYRLKAFAGGIRDLSSRPRGVTRHQVLCRDARFEPIEHGLEARIRQ
jgi:hypothetical protein